RGERDGCGHVRGHGSSADRGYDGRVLPAGAAGLARGSAHRATVRVTKYRQEAGRRHGIIPVKLATYKESWWPLACNFPRHAPELCSLSRAHRERSGPGARAPEVDVARRSSSGAETESAGDS